jgi:hypothetical protein
MIVSRAAAAAAPIGATGNSAGSQAFVETAHNKKRRSEFLTFSVFEC